MLILIKYSLPTSNIFVFTVKNLELSGEYTNLTIQILNQSIKMIYLHEKSMTFPYGPK